MSKKLKFGIIGCGWIGQIKHIPAYSNQPDTEVIALCDIERAKAEEGAERNNLKDVIIYTDYKEMLKDSNIDVVVICTPNKLHCEMTVAAFEAGKHVLCEKPMATTVIEARKMIDASKKVGKKLTIGYQWRWRPECLYIKEMCEKGELGEIYFAKAHGLRRRGVPTWGTYFDESKNGGGVLMDGAPHSLDLTLWTMNNYEPLSVKANTYRKMYDKTEGNPWGSWDPDEFGVEDSGFAIITMKNGATIYLEAAWLINLAEANDMKTTLCGTKAGVDMFDSGGIRVNLVHNGKMAIMKPEVKQGFVPGVETALDPFQYEARHWIDCIKNDTEPAVKPEEALVVTQIIEGIYLSAETGKEIFF